MVSGNCTFLPVKLLTQMHSLSTQKHIFSGTLLAMLSLGALSSVFRTDNEARIVSLVCVGNLGALSMWLYVGRHWSLPKRGRPR